MEQFPPYDMPRLCQIQLSWTLPRLPSTWSSINRFAKVEHSSNITANPATVHSTMDTSEVASHQDATEISEDSHDMQESQHRDYGSPSQMEYSIASLDEEEVQMESHIASLVEGPSFLNETDANIGPAKLNGHQPELRYAIKSCSNTEFLEGDDQTYAPHLDIIQVLLGDPLIGQMRRKVSRKLASTPVHSTADVLEPVPVPTMVRIHSRFLLDLLQDITHTSLEYIGRDTEHGKYCKVDSYSVASQRSFVFLHPFKLFVRYESEIRNCEKALATKFGMGGTNQSEQTVQETSEASENFRPIQSTLEPVYETPGDTKPSSSEESTRYESKNAYLHLKLLIQLFDNHLSSVFALRHSLNTGESTTITFENLWLLFDHGELVYLRNSDGTALGQLPMLGRVTQFTGGRRAPHCIDEGDINPITYGPKWSRYIPLNETNCLGQFTISVYMIESDGENFGPTQLRWMIPTWDGERAINDLECFPVRFCRPGVDFPHDSLDAWKYELAQGGKQFSRLTSGSLMEYHGIGINEDLTEQEVNQFFWIKVKIVS